MATPQIHTLALDLEGTLVSNAVSLFPRPGLHEFLVFCHNSFPNVVLFTTVREERARQVLQVLYEEGSIPDWFRGITCVSWTGKTKDLHFVGHTPVGEILLVDDMEIYIHPDQHAQWIPVKCFEAPYHNSDRELEQVTEELKKWLDP